MSKRRRRSRESSPSFRSTPFSVVGDMVLGTGGLPSRNDANRGPEDAQWRPFGWVELMGLPPVAPKPGLCILSFGVRLGAPKTFPVPSPLRAEERREEDRNGYPFERPLGYIPLRLASPTRPPSRLLE